jgi:hypothetical protein
MKENTLFLLEMGMDDPKISTDIKNHRVRVLNNIDIEYKGEKYNMFFEFMQAEHYEHRTTNLRTGKPLKKAVRKLIIQDGMAIDTQFERDEIGHDRDGKSYTYQSSWRKADLEREFWDQHLAYTRENVLKVVNAYITGPKYTKVVLIREAARDIINRIGGEREKSIIQGAWHYSKVADTWTDEHKVVRFIKQVKTETGPGCYQYLDGQTCDVDIVTGKICG